MAGSLGHVVDDKTGKFTMNMIENMGDAHETLHECFEIIRVLTAGEKKVVNEACRVKNFPEITIDMVESGWDI